MCGPSFFLIGTSQVGLASMSYPEFDPGPQSVAGERPESCAHWENFGE